MKVTNQQEWSQAIAKAVELLAECNKFQLNERFNEGFNDSAKILGNPKTLIDYVEENADACGLFEMVAEKIQGK